MLGFIRFVLIAVLLLASASYAIAQPRVATVIGNGDYVKPGWRLKNPVNDAHLMADTLRSIGYEVKVYENLDENEMEAAFQDHGNRLAAKGPDTIGVFYFAGHGVQSGKYNYLMPVDARPSTEQDVWAQAPRLGLATEFMESAGNAVNFIILDACRDNPLPRARRTGASGGLGQPKRARGFVFAYATEPGRTAADGVGTNSPFTEALAAILPTQGLSYFDVLSLVTDRVDDATNGGQTPYLSTGLIGGTGVCLNPNGCGGPIQAVAAPASASGGASVARSTGSASPSEVRPGMSEEARQYAEECDAGDLSQCRNLGISYRNGHGVSQDYDEAVRLYRKACDGGHALGCSNLGFMYSKGLGVSQDHSEAARFYRKACDDGHALGCNNLGLMYRKGNGVSQDDVEAARLYRKACDGGHAQGCSNLGFMYSKGLGVSQDDVEAARLFRKGCEGDDALSCTNLGAFYYNGTGSVSQDKAEAVRLFRKACEGGDGTGCKYLKALTEQ